MKVHIDVPLLALFIIGHLIPAKDRRENINGKPWPKCTLATTTMTLQFVNTTEEQYCLQKRRDYVNYCNNIYAKQSLYGEAFLLLLLELPFEIEEASLYLHHFNVTIVYKRTFYEGDGSFCWDKRWRVALKLNVFAVVRSWCCEVHDMAFQ